MQKTIAIGFYFISALFVLGVATALVGHLPIFGEPIVIGVKFDQIEGLRKGDNVRVDGAQMGKVIDVEVVDDGILVTALLSRDIVVSEKNVDITVDFLSILGGNHLSIHRAMPAPDGASIRTLFEEKRLKAGRKKPSIVDEFTGLVQENRQNIKETIASANEVFTAIKEGKGTIGKAVMDPKLYDEATALIENINQGKGTLGKLATDDSLYNDLKKVTTELQGTQGTIGKLINDPEMAKKFETIVNDAQATIASAKNIMQKIEKGEGTIGKFIQDESVYNDAKEAIHVLGRAARSTVYVYGDYFSGADSEMGIAKVGIEIWPSEDKYFRVGAAALLLSRDGDVAFERLIEQDEDDTIIKADVQIGYVIPWFLDKRLTARIGLLEGKPGGALEFAWEDFGFFEHPLRFVLEARQAYSDIDDEDIDEGVGKTYQRAYVTFPLYPPEKKDQKYEWYEKILRSTRVFVGGARLFDDDPEFFAGIGIQYADEDFRTLVGLLGTAR